VRLILQELIEVEATQEIGAAPYERAETRTNERNGSRPRLLATQAGDIELATPKLRKGSFFLSILEPRRRIDQVLFTVVMEAYVAGVSTRSVDDLVAALGIVKSEVSRICAGLDEIVGAFGTRQLDHVEFLHVYLDATYLHVRNQTSQVVSMAVVVATGITANGDSEILGCDIGDSEGETFWRGFLRSLKARGLGGVKLVISDQHAGLVAALTKSFQIASHQRCRVHFARNLLSLVPRSHTDMVAAVFPHHLRPTQRRRCLRHLGSGPRPTRLHVPQDRPADEGRQDRSAASVTTTTVLRETRSTAAPTHVLQRL